jgi:hypothetical protein
MSDPYHGLSPIFARSMLKRVLERARIDIDALREEDLESALPKIREALETFLPMDEVSRCVALIKDVVRGGEGSGDPGGEGSPAPAVVFAEPAPRPKK